MERYRDTVLRPIIDSRFGKDFQKEYEISLSKIRIIDDKGFEQFVEQRLKEGTESKIYYEYVREGLCKKDKHIQKVDKAGRIYHILTNTKREVKQFLNIAISADCKNSHPVLFNYFIFKHYGLSIEDSYTISSAIHHIDDALDVRKRLSMIVPKRLLDLLPNDVLKYIYLTQTGQFWDTMLIENSEYNRGEIKKMAFAQIFYSNIDHIKCYQSFAVEFKKQFPNVMKLIKFWKKEENREWVKEYMDAHGISTDKPTAALSIAMMSLEANIFTEVLKRMYSKRWRAFHIHDCIIVPHTRSKNQPTRNEVVSIMKEEYKKYGLIPTFD